MQMEIRYKTEDIVEKISFGIPRNPDVFVREAIKAGHPRFLDYKSIAEIDSLLEQNLAADSSSILCKRAKEMDNTCKGADE